MVAAGAVARLRASVRRVLIFFLFRTHIPGLHFSARHAATRSGLASRNFCAASCVAQATAPRLQNFRGDFEFADSRRVESQTLCGGTRGAGDATIFFFLSAASDAGKCHVLNAEGRVRVARVDAVVALHSSAATAEVSSRATAAVSSRATAAVSSRATAVGRNRWQRRQCRLTSLGRLPRSGSTIRTVATPTKIDSAATDHYSPALVRPSPSPRCRRPSGRDVLCWRPRPRFRPRVSVRPTSLFAVPTPVTPRRRSVAAAKAAVEAVAAAAEAAVTIGRAFVGLRDPLPE